MSYVASSQDIERIIFIGDTGPAIKYSKHPMTTTRWVPKDTICLDLEEAKKVLTDARQKKILEREIEVYRDDVRLLTANITNLEQQLNQALRADSLDRVVIKLLTDQIALHQQNRQDLELKITGLEKEVKRWRRKNFWTGAIGMATTITFGFLYLTK